MRRRHTVARIVAAVALCLAVADGFRWGNRWYVSTMYDRSGSTVISHNVLMKAHDALLHGLVWLAVALVAAVVGWQLHLVRRRSG
ncbi:hypothetical protein ACQFYA_02330 [Promicromonospora sp. Marseille-Q5078]